jgi:hypothetical protein
MPDLERDDNDRLTPRMIAELLQAETVPRDRWRLFWMSFADAGGFKGCAIVRAANYGHAIQRCWDLKVNPGGEVLGGPMPLYAEEYVPSEYLDRLLNRPECVHLDEHLARRLRGEP